MSSIASVVHRWPARLRPVRMELIKEGSCPECGGSLSADISGNDLDRLRCPACGHNALAELERNEVAMSMVRVGLGLRPHAPDR